MPTDKENLLTFLMQAGVGFEAGRDCIELVAKECVKVDGYTGFTTLFEFNEGGSLKEISILE